MTISRKITLVHASRAAVEPLMRYYPKEAPEFEVTNLLDDGVMRLFSAGRMETAHRRLGELIATGRDLYEADLVLLTCSAVPRGVMAGLRAAAGIPLVKIDEPMAKLAVGVAGRAAGRIGVVVTFPPTVESTRKLLTEAAEERGASTAAALEIDVELVPEALSSLLAGDTAAHDAMLLNAAQVLAARGAGAIVLAQVSMAHLVEPIREKLKLPVFSSLETSLAAIRGILDR